MHNEPKTAPRSVIYRLFLTLFAIGTLAASGQSMAYPIFAQQGYENPREATGRIVCANCHLAKNLSSLKYLKLSYQILCLKQLSKSLMILKCSKC